MIEIQPGLIYLTREDWGARTDIPRLGHPVNRLDRTEAIMHHTVIIDNDATPNRWETLAEVNAKMVQLQTIRPDLGLDVPYNDVAFHMEDGTLIICEGRGFDRTGAHTHAHNTRGMATAGQGNFQRGQSISPYIDHWSRWWGYQKYDMGMENLGSSRPTSGPNVGAIAFGHRDLSATTCPGDNLYAINPQLTFQTQEDDMPSQEEWDAMRAWQRATSPTLRDEMTTSAFLIQGRKHRLINPDVAGVLGYLDEAYLLVPHDYILLRAPDDGGALTLAEAEAIVNPEGGSSVPALPSIEQLAEALKIVPS